MSTCCGPGQCRGWRGPDLSGGVEAWVSWSGSGEPSELPRVVPEVQSSLHCIPLCLLSGPASSPSFERGQSLTNVPPPEAHPSNGFQGTQTPDGKEQEPISEQAECHRVPVAHGSKLGYPRAVLKKTKTRRQGRDPLIGSCVLAFSPCTQSLKGGEDS